MKLDIELCRKILQTIEEHGGVDGLQRFPHIEDVDDQHVFYQIKKMSEAGYVSHKVYCCDSGSEFNLFKVDVSFQGHEFLRQMLDDTIWNKTKDIAKKGGLSLTFETIKAIIPVAINSVISAYS
ncbi:DUF2513 domain-containing protein [Sphingobacterium sp. SGG-5]|uniref:DUF2513 domain-containing protein n=1 Tax=Sphingobacterium sp. SGG-5 TaxID=2710881 RepID=UPI0013EC6949|nr:DUF2513 domain-containing protein [Sphingobacterium sp. SGG-5]NGM63562.1 DUF2513 domain-containing protein [Sphingobacterium sp. SGG-5]